MHSSGLARKSQQRVTAVVLRKQLTIIFIERQQSREPDLLGTRMIP